MQAQNYENIGLPTENNSIGKPSGNHPKATEKAEVTKKATEKSKWGHEKPDPPYENVWKS